jgi:hypothetical protein
MIGLSDFLSGVGLIWPLTVLPAAAAINAAHEMSLIRIESSPAGARSVSPLRIALQGRERLVLPDLHPAPVVVIVIAMASMRLHLEAGDLDQRAVIAGAR